MLSVSAFSSLHQFIFCQSRPLPICWVRVSAGDGETRRLALSETRAVRLPEARDSFRIMLLTQWQFCEVCVENIQMPSCLSPTLGGSSPNLLMTWRKELRKQHEQKGLGTLLSACTHGTLFLRYIWVK